MRRWLYFCVFLFAAATLWGQGSATRLSSGLTVLANYTFAKLIDDGSGDGANPSDPFNFRSRRGPGDFDIQHPLSRHVAGSWGDTRNPGGPNANQSAATFGGITGAGSPRVIQLALKYMF